MTVAVYTMFIWVSGNIFPTFVLLKYKLSVSSSVHSSVCGTNLNLKNCWCTCVRPFFVFFHCVLYAKNIKTLKRPCKRFICCLHHIQFIFKMLFSGRQSHCAQAEHKRIFTLKTHTDLLLIFTKVYKLVPFFEGWSFVAAALFAWQIHS